MRSDGEATKARILDAARVEFAAFGLAGARVDRIATAANASKERLYAYFGDKLSLFRAVLELNRNEVSEAMPIDIDDLPGFVGVVFDHMVSHPEHLRTLHWARLEGVIGAMDEKHRKQGFPERDRLVEAQAQGRIDSEWDPEDLIALLFGLASTWASSPGIMVDGGLEPTTNVIRRRRAAAVRAAQKLVQPATAPRSDDRARS